MFRKLAVTYINNNVVMPQLPAGVLSGLLEGSNQTWAAKTASFGAL